MPAMPPTARRAPFVAREAEWARLLELVDDLGAGRGAMVLVAGEPGIGKTRLVDELMEEARKRGVLTLLGHCSEMEGVPPYLPVVESWKE